PRRAPSHPARVRRAPSRPRRRSRAGSSRRQVASSLTHAPILRYRYPALPTRAPGSLPEPAPSNASQATLRGRALRRVRRAALVRDGYRLAGLWLLRHLVAQRLPQVRRRDRADEVERDDRDDRAERDAAELERLAEPQRRVADRDDDAGRD